MISENNIRVALIALIISVLAIVAYIIPTPETVEAPTFIEVAHAQEEFVVENHHSKTVSLHPELVPICACESVGDPDAEPRQFHIDGRVIKNASSSAIGMCQILEGVHGVRAKTLGLDLRTEEGNITFANLLFEEQGRRPWKESKACWDI